MAVTILYENETSIDLGLPCEELAAQVAEQVLKQEGCPFDAQINLVLTDNPSIRKVNAEFRNIDKETDVLSFPENDFYPPACFDQIEEDDTCFDLDTGELLLGDIMISAQKVISQAAEYGHTVKREFCFLLAHSMLHLLGYDHIEPEQAEDMEARQEKALMALGITR
ncbi:MAG: rRNA maturation RNase YbeY [Blautia sp.]|nr:rRNA maturation RNase YbeY [Blautia sp.]